MADIISLQTYLTIVFFSALFFAGFLETIDAKHDVTSRLLTMLFAAMFGAIWPVSLPVFAGMAVAVMGKKS